MGVDRPLFSVIYHPQEPITKTFSGNSLKKPTFFYSSFIRNVKMALEFLDSS